MSLEDLKNRYRVTLTDGSAQFLIETGRGFEQAMGHVPEFLEAVGPKIRAEGHGRIEAQYLRPSRRTFREGVAALAPKLIEYKFPTSVRAKLQDFAYLADFEIDGDSFQFNIGVVRKEEISRRVDARVVKPPAVATFCKIVRTWRSIENANDCTAALKQTLVIGRSIMKELEQPK